MASKEDDPTGEEAPADTVLADEESAEEGEGGGGAAPGSEEGGDSEDESPGQTEEQLKFAFKMKEIRRLFNLLLEDYPVNLGKSISKKQRERERLKEPMLAYGEMTLDGFASLLRTICEEYDGLQGEHQVFCDIGSGTGKPCFAAALLHTWKRCTGVEILSGLHGASLEVADRWRKMMESVEDDIMSPEQRRVEMEFLHMDAKSEAFSMADCTLGLANSTCFDEELMIYMAAKADQMKGGSFFITVTKRLPSLSWDVLDQEKIKMSWGEANVFLHRRKPEDWQEQQLKAEEAKKKEEEEEEERIRQAAEDAENSDEDLLARDGDGITTPPQ
jgi:hypothetical protein